MNDLSHTAPPPGVDIPEGAPPPTPTPPASPTVVAPPSATTVDLADERRSVLRVPKLSPLAPLLGWVVAWGAIAISAASLERLGIPYGFNLGIADGGPGDDGIWAGTWALVTSGAAFLVGGYAAARMARAHGVRHALFVWIIAMVASVVDAVIEASGNGTDGVIQLIPGVPFWNGTGLSSSAEAVLIMMIFAGVSLVGALTGGLIGQTANRLDRTDGAIVFTSHE
jgi:hypothetical protein